MHKLTILPDNRVLDIRDGESVLGACRRGGVLLQAYCGGKGACGKCVVHVRAGAAPTHPHAVRGLTAEEAAQGFRLACQCRAHGDLTIEIPASSRGFGEQILTRTGEPRGRRAAYRPNVRAHYVELPRPSLHDQLGDFERLVRALPGHGNGLEAGMEQLRELPAVLRAGDFKVTATLCGSRLLCAEPGDARGRAFGLACDIGTTTVVGYLLDLSSGAELAVACRSNPQAACGEDVLSRSDYANRSPAARRELQALVMNCIQEIAEECAAKAKVQVERFFEIALAGNTIMTHLALGANPQYITMVPFTPVWTHARAVPVRELGLKLHPEAMAYVLPCVAGYVGGDITGGMIAADLEKREKLTLFVDIGTNGEVVLGNRARLLACSAAAGPAFEGARISCGMRAVPGAIDHITYDVPSGDLALHVLGDEPPVGVCGTGLLDAAAALLQAGALQPNGLLLGPAEARAKLPPKLAARVRAGEKGSEVVLAPQAATLDGRRDLTLTQRDMRELQLAKGALRAGVDLALQTWGATGAQLDRVLVAGGFGNFILPASALAIGLFPPDVRLEQLEFVGNSAGAGAKLCLRDVRQRRRVERLARHVEYIELSGRPDFQTAFMESMLFPGDE